MKERWLPVPGFEGLYEASDCGRVKSLRRGRVMRLSCDAYGYSQVGLHLGRPAPAKTVKVHRIVATLFHGPAPEGKPEVDHTDRNRTNNHWKNLRWSSVPDNRIPGTPRGRSGVIGVCHRPTKAHPWQAYHAIGGHMKSLGHFATKQEAVATRRAFDQQRTQRV